VTTCAGIAGTVLVIVAIRGVRSGFAEKLAVIMPFPVPPGVAVHQDALLLVVQAVLDVTVNDVLPAAAPAFWLGGVTEMVGRGAEAVNVASMLKL
jgi:hypothetical protein